MSSSYLNISLIFFGILLFMLLIVVMIASGFGGATIGYAFSIFWQKERPNKSPNKLIRFLCVFGLGLFLYTLTQMFALQIEFYIYIFFFDSTLSMSHTLNKQIPHNNLNSVSFILPIIVAFLPLVGGFISGFSKGVNNRWNWL